MISDLLLLAFLCFLPVFELRFAIPFGILGLGLNPLLVSAICILSNYLAGIFIYTTLDVMVSLFCKLKFFKKIYESKVMTVQQNIHPRVEKYGIIGLALFIGVPLPFSGIYSGALAAKIIGMDLKEYLLASLLGILISGLIMTGISIFFSEALNIIGFNEDRINLIQ